MGRYDFLLDTYDTERIKTLSVWSQFADADLPFRPEPRARSSMPGRKARMVRCIDLTLRSKEKSQSSSEQSSTVP